MTDVAVFAVLALGIGLVSIYGRSPWLRTTAFAGLALGMVTFWYTSLGLPRPQYLAPNGTILAYRLDEPSSIYLWLVPAGSAQPISLQLPWRNDVASSLVDAARHRSNPGDSLKIKATPGAMGLPTKPQFYVRHAQALPPKSGT